MNSKVTLGSVVYGLAGVGCKVLAIDGDTITIETPSGQRKTSIDRVLSVEPPKPLAKPPLGGIAQFQLGDSPKGTLLGETHAVGERSETCRQTGTSARFHPLRERVTYIGTDPNLQRQYSGELEVWEISKCGDGYACLKPDGRVTSWIRFEDLGAIGSIRPLPPPLTTRELRLGERVEIVSTSEWGVLGQWNRGRTKAIVELDDGSRSDWVKVAALRYLEEG